MNTIHVIHKSEIPRERIRDIMYGRIIVAYRPKKKEQHRSCLMVGGDCINYPFDTSTPTVDLTTIKMLWNLVLSTENTKFFTIDIANFYFGTPLERPEYMRLATKVLLPRDNCILQSHQKEN